MKHDSTRMARRVTGALLALMATCGIPASAARMESGGGMAAPEAKAGPDLMLVLKRLVRDRSAEESLKAVNGLRALRDGELVPLFSKLARGPVPGLRGPAVLALAELDDVPGLDLLMLRGLDARTQGSVIVSALSAGELPVAQMREVIRWGDLPARLHLAIGAKLAAAGERVESSRLAAIASGSESIGPGGVRAAEADRVSAANAALLQSHGGEEQPSTELLESVLAEGRTNEGREELRGVLVFVRTARLGSAGGFVRRVMERYADDRTLMFEAVATLLMIDEPTARLGDGWQVQFSRAQDEGERHQLALAALEAGSLRPAAIPASIIDRLREDPAGLMRGNGEVLAAMRAWGQAGNQGQAGDVPEALLEALRRLVGFAHGPTLDWMLGWAKQHPGQPAREIWAAMVDQLASQPNEELDERVTAAAAGLAGDEPNRLLPALEKALKAEDERATERLLLGLLRTGGAMALVAAPLADLPVRISPPGTVRPVGGAGGGGAEDVAGGFPWPGATSESLAMIVRARGRVEAEPAIVESLDRIATGLGQLEPGQRAQAAWLSLRLRGAHRAALTRLLGEIGSR